MAKSPNRLSASEAVRRMADKRLKARDLVEACLDRIEAREGQVHAWEALDPEGARKRADSLDKRARPVGPLHGIPLAVKDIISTKTMPTTCGSPIYRDHVVGKDAACVAQLVKAGAIVLGKSVTTEFAGGHAGKTHNPHNLRHTPAGSSSGSAAAVGANMVPAAIGTQVGGSIIRPAAYCGNYALKPTQGGINRGERQATSQSTHGPHANSLQDMWQVAIEIANRAGGDRGAIGLVGPSTLPAPAKPSRLVVLETEGWPEVDAATRAGFEVVLKQLADAGVTLIRRKDHPWVEALEQTIANGRAICGGVTGWENRWYQRGIVDNDPDGVSARAKAALAKAEAMTPNDYRMALMARENAQRVHATMAPLADAAITLACPGPAPVWSGDVPGQPLAARPTGDFVFNAPSSMLFAPVVTMPLMSVGGLPVGVQVMGQQHEDARMTGLARWMSETLKPVATA